MDLTQYYNEHINLHNKGMAVDWQKVSATLMQALLKIAQERDKAVADLTSQTTPPQDPPAEPAP